MIDIKFKVLPAGEGKTRWLVEKAFDECSKGNSVFLLTNDNDEFQKFMIRYRTSFSMYCPVKMLETTSPVPNNAIVLIDNFTEKVSSGLIYMSTIQTSAKEVFATLTGKLIV
jgi:hypothetical protein